MKKILLTSIALAGAVSAFGQGQIYFENASSSSTFVKLAPLGSTSYAQGVSKTGSGLVVELYWNNGTSYVLEDTYTSTYTGLGQGGQGPGFFNAGELTIPQSGTESFYVEAFYTSGGLEYSGTTTHFTASVTVSPAPTGHTDTGGSWFNGGAAGDMIITPVPEPATIALGGIGAAALLLFRRRK
jgi:hypothetical protein